MEHDYLKELFKLAKLTDREIYVICHHLGLYNAKQQTLEECGNKLNVTRERVRQIESTAILKLKRTAAFYERNPKINKCIETPSKNSSIKNSLCLEPNLTK